MRPSRSRVEPHSEWVGEAFEAGRGPTLASQRSVSRQRFAPAVYRVGTLSREDAHAPRAVNARRSARRRQRWTSSSHRKGSLDQLRKRENRAVARFTEPSAGLEPATPSLPWRFQSAENGSFPGISVSLALSGVVRILRRFSRPMFPWCSPLLPTQAPRLLRKRRSTPEHDRGAHRRRGRDGTMVGYAARICCPKATRQPDDRRGR